MKIDNIATWTYSNKIQKTINWKKMFKFHAKIEKNPSRLKRYKKSRCTEKVLSAFLYNMKAIEERNFLNLKWQDTAWKTDELKWFMPNPEPRIYIGSPLYIGLRCPKS